MTTTRARFGAMQKPVALAPTPKSDEVALRLYSAIDSWGGEWGVSASEFAASLDAVPSDTSEIHLYVNSPGGEVYEGLAIMNQLRAHPARIVAHVDGLAASAASFIVAAADEVVMARNSELMIHDAHGAAVGPAETMHAMAADLDRISDNIASIYADKAGGDPAEWRAAMRAETWLSAEQAVEVGLADRIDGKADEQAKATARADLARFTNRADRASAPTDSPAASAAGSTSPAPAPRGDTNQEGAAVAFSDEQLSTLRAMVGVSPDADEATIVAAAKEALEERAEAPQPTNSIPEGMAVMDAAALDQLRRDAELGRKAHEAQAKADRERIVNEAVTDGRIPPARKGHWLNMLAADPGASEVLASLEPGLAVPTRELGHAAEGEVVKQVDNLYAEIYGTTEKAGA